MTETTEIQTARIMVVDDLPDNLKVLEKLLCAKGYKVFSFTNAKQALAAAQRKSPDLVLLDVNMPEMDGFEMCEHLKKNRKLRDIPVLFLSGLSDMSAKLGAFAAGGVDYITKPFNKEEILARVGTHLQNALMKEQLRNYNDLLEERVRSQVKEISDSQRATIIALAKLTESRDDETGHHIERVQVLCRFLSKQLSNTSVFKNSIDDGFIDNIYHASALHDIGKVGIKDSVLLKPGKLTIEEFEYMKLHTVLGSEMLAKVNAQYPQNQMVNMGRVIARHHHERWDGTGYPDGLAGDAIPLPARIMALADIYDALCSERPYKPPFSHEESRDIILECGGKHLDPNVVDIFREVEGEFNEIRNGMSG